MLSLRALLATALLALTLTGSAGAFEDDESGPPMVGEYAVDVSSAPTTGSRSATRTPP